MIILCRTSNPGADPIQCYPPEDPLYLRIAGWAERDWNTHGNVMLVTGATQADDLERVRARAPTLPLLVPGIGAQGGDLNAAMAAGLRPDGLGIVVNSARGIIHAGDGSAAAVRAAAVKLRATINSQRPPPAGDPAAASGAAAL